MSSLNLNSVVRNVMPLSRLVLKDDNQENLDVKNQDNQEIKVIQVKSSKYDFIYLIIFLILGYYAAKLSWDANVKFNYSYLTCVLCAVLAFFNAPLFLIGYFLYRADLVDLVTKNPNLVA
jgi:hypothetical protein